MLPRRRQGRGGRSQAGGQGSLGIASNYPIAPEAAQPEPFKEEKQQSKGKVLPGLSSPASFDSQTPKSLTTQAQDQQLQALWSKNPTIICEPWFDVLGMRTSVMWYRNYSQAQERGSKFTENFFKDMCACACGCVST